jgi:uncharacterized protein
MQATDNEALIRGAFEAWAAGDVQAFFAIVADGVRWTITGSCPVSGSYAGKQDFLKRAVGPVFDRLATPIQPRLRGLMASDGGAVLLWDGEARTRDGARYFNEFCWVLRLENRQIVECTAYFDTVAATELLR